MALHYCIIWSFSSLHHIKKQYTAKHHIDHRMLHCTTLHDSHQVITSHHTTLHWSPPHYTISYRFALLYITLIHSWQSDLTSHHIIRHYTWSTSLRIALNLVGNGVSAWRGAIGSLLRFTEHDNSCPSLPESLGSCLHEQRTLLCTHPRGSWSQQRNRSHCLSNRCRCKGRLQRIKPIMGRRRRRRRGRLRWQEGGIKMIWWEDDEDDILLWRGEEKKEKKERKRWSRNKRRRKMMRTNEDEKAKDREEETEKNVWRTRNKRKRRRRKQGEDRE